MTLPGAPVRFTPPQPATPSEPLGRPGPSDHPDHPDLPDELEQRDLLDPGPARAVVVSPSKGRPRPTARLRRLRRRRRRALTIGTVVAVALVGAVVAGVGPVRDRLADLVPSQGGPPAPPAASSVLLAWTDAGTGDATIVLLGAPGLTQGSGLLIPGGTQVEVPSFGSQTLEAVLTSGGPDTLALAVENSIGYDVGNVVAFDRSQLEAFLGTGGELAVRLRSAVSIGERSFPPTGERLRPEDAALLATTHAEESTDLDHLVVVHAVLEGWLDGISDAELDHVQAVLAGLPGSDEERVSEVVTVLGDLADRHVTFDTLDVVSLGVPGEERYRIDKIGAAEEMEALFPGLAFGPPGPRVRVEILNGTGVAGIATEAARRLVPEGAEVVLTGNASSFGMKETVLVLQDAGAEPDARRLVQALGTGQIRMATNPLGVADISIVLGADFDPGGE